VLILSVAVSGRTLRPVRALDRRQFLLGAVAAAAAVAGACGRTRELPLTKASIGHVAPPAAPPDLDTNEPEYVEAARAFLVTVPPAVVARARALLPPETRIGLDHGLLALSERCPSDGLQLKHCPTSAWFECPGCGSQFDALGDKTGGPAPQGMSLHGISVEGDVVSIVAKPRLDGLPFDVRLVDHPAAGPHCV
jgi:Rieske Fe-S protein